MDIKKLSQKISELASEEIIRKDIVLDEDAKEVIENIALSHSEELNIDDYTRVVNRVYGRLRGQLGVISYLLDDDTVCEIMVNGNEDIFIERFGKLIKIDDSYDSKEELEQVIRRIAGTVRREINEMSPILDARLKDGSRVNAVLKNVSLDGPSLTVRKFRHRRISMEEMVATGGLTEDARVDLEKLVLAGYNIFVSGGTSSGKTTFLNALSEYIPSTERVITIEDSAELQLSEIPNLIRMECRSENTSGQGRVTMDMLIRSSLRMRPDRIIVGEVRGREVADMLQALNTGHSGMSTGHGNSIKGMLRRLEAMYIAGTEMPLDAIRAQIVEAIDIMVQLGRLSDGKRKVLEISEITGFNGNDYDIVPLYVSDQNLALVKTGEKISNSMKLKLKGLSYD